MVQRFEEALAEGMGCLKQLVSIPMSVSRVEGEDGTEQYLSYGTLCR